MSRTHSSKERDRAGGKAKKKKSTKKMAARKESTTKKTTAKESTKVSGKSKVEYDRFIIFDRSREPTYRPYSPILEVR